MKAWLTKLLYDPVLEMLVTIIVLLLVVWGIGSVCQKVLKW